MRLRRHPCRASLSLSSNTREALLPVLTVVVGPRTRRGRTDGRKISRNIVPGLRLRSFEIRARAEFRPEVHSVEALLKLGYQLHLVRLDLAYVLLS